VDFIFNPIFLRIGIIIIVSVIAYTLISMGDRAIKRRYPLNGKNNLAARKMYTNVEILKHVLTFFLAILTVGAVLMVFAPFRQIGASIWASAGIIGIAAGFAAQRSLMMIIAGIQIAVTQPIRIDDVLVVEGEWGNVEEINLTYVVLKTWDLRRIIIPVNYFIDKPFENWTRTNTDLIGIVFFHVDYTAPIPLLRAEFERIVKASPLWDGKVQVLQVTEVKADTLELRALMSAEDSTKAWELRCEVREKLITYLKVYHPECLPRTRAEIAGTPSPHDMLLAPSSTTASTPKRKTTRTTEKTLS
jgi:small-conductance mechanosensitive channel